MSASLPIAIARAILRLACTADGPRLLRYRLANREHLAPWEPARGPDWFTLRHCVETLADAQEAARQDRAYLLLALDPVNGEVLASISFSNVTRGVFQACHLGYGIDVRRQGQGLMRELLAPRWRGRSTICACTA